jgi:hypothetical protein
MSPIYLSQRFLSRAHHPNGWLFSAHIHVVFQLWLCHTAC